ncbi:aquaporin AQPAe.a-like isoform X2 [Venturia canescens]|uniref:aquaporin AQPAe.a-like isoform X2 n=1 Tax=Venturia canescens TaxID=32260 RepID=UPI001C9C1E1E|nr:aquaporin AQPAe.a-like isoform X2 [Venturia canescens]
MKEQPETKRAADGKGVKELFQEDYSAWDTMKIALAEFIGTAILVFIGCMGCVGSLGNQPLSLHSSLGFGLAVMIVILSIGHISDAHINPAITVGAVVLGKKSLRLAAVYLVAQCLGAVVGYGLLKVVTPQSLLYGVGGPDTTANFCITAIHKDISLIQGFLAEVIATAILMLMACGIWDVRNERNTDSVALKFAFGVTALCMAVAPYTGCSMNPARSLGPAIWNNSWSDHWVFWFGPIAGSLLSSIMYRSIFSPAKGKPEDGLNFDATEVRKPEV